MGRRAQRLKITLLNMVIAALLIVLGYLAWRLLESHTVIRDLRETLRQVEAERRELQASLNTLPASLKVEDQQELRAIIERQTSELRQLPLKQPVNYKSLAREELHEVLVRLIHEQYSPEEIRRYGRALETLGVIPAGTDLLQLWLNLYGEQVGAFYVPQEHALYTFKDLSLGAGLDKMVLAHELTHALQDQHFDLAGLPLHVKDNDDLALATAALIEGDATVLMTEFYAANFDRRRVMDDLGAMLGQSTQNLQDAPIFLRDLLLFPYQEGQKFAMALYLRGGMEELNRAFARPPTTTEQVLHPNRFLEHRDEPTPIDATAPRLGGWQMIWENVLGEFGVRSLLQTELRRAEAQLAAEGWDGDRYWVYEQSPGGPAGFVWQTIWDSEQDAVEFAASYKNLATRQGWEPRVVRDGIRVLVVASQDPSFYEQWDRVEISRQ